MTALTRGIDPIVVAAPVVEVTLFEDRARVVRSGSTKLPAGHVRVRVTDVAPVLVDSTLVATAESRSARVVDSRVFRRIVTVEGRGENEEPSNALEEARDELARRVARLGSEQESCERQTRSLDDLADLTVKEIAEDVSWGRIEEEEWSERLRSSSRSQRKAQLRLVEVAHELERLCGELRRVERRLAAQRNPAREEAASLEVELLVERAGDVEIRCEYVVPGACWRPYHTARLGDAATLDFSTDGCVWQNTGEEWCDVRLRFSTVRPSLGTDPPTLTSDVLSLQRKQETVVVEAREQEIMATGLGAETGTASTQLPGVDDGGETVSLQAESLASVPSDGRAYRVPLLRFESQAVVGLTAIPEMVPAVLLQTEQRNGADAPILAGPVDLIRGGGFAGRTSVLFVAPGERFTLGWGPDPALRVQRDTEVTRDKDRVLSAWETRRHRTRVRISNIGDQSKILKVTERVPVSEIDKVEIEPDIEVITDRLTPDENGFLEWTVQLQPFDTKRLELGYTLKKHQEVQGI